MVTDKVFEALGDSTRIKHPRRASEKPEDNKGRAQAHSVSGTQDQPERYCPVRNKDASSPVIGLAKW